MSGATPTPWMDASPGVRYWAVVSLSPSRGSSEGRRAPGTGEGMSNNICTEPLPKVVSPMTTPRSRFLIAPATISDALAERASTSTASGSFRLPPGLATSSRRWDPPTPTIDTRVPEWMKASATFEAWS
jgi:hypothetical protein